MDTKVRIFTGDKRKDYRGSVSFINDFSFSHVKRFYQIKNADTTIIRAFHGHMKEAKYIYVAKGSLLLCVAKLDSPEAPSKKMRVEKFILTDKVPQIVYIPPAFANGMRSLTKDTIVTVYSTSTLAESLTDDYRYPFDYWGKNIWSI